MRTLAIAVLFFTFGCAFGCKNDQGQEMPNWDGSFCDIGSEGVTCDGILIKYGTPEFKKLWIMNNKSIYCLHNQFINNAKEWVDPHKKCDYEPSK